MRTVSRQRSTGPASGSLHPWEVDPPDPETHREASAASLAASFSWIYWLVRDASTGLTRGGPIEREYAAEAIQYRWLDRRNDVP